LLTGATGFLGAFLLSRVLATSWRRVWCVVRAADVEAARRRLGEAAARYSLPAPDHARVGIVLGDLRDVEAACERYELGSRVGHVLHCAARVVFTEPYRVLRDDNVLPVVGLVRWMRRHGVEELSFVSSLAATGRALGAAGAILETREQPLDPEQGGYGVGKWVAERILERAERDGMHVRVFRPGLILAATRSGACNPKDLIWRLLASGVALGAYPLDERPLTTAPVDVVASVISKLMFERGSAGKAYHLVDAEPVSPRRLFESLRQAGVTLEPQPLDEWHQLVGDAAVTTGNELLASMVLYERAGHELDGIVQAEAWQPWLRRLNLSASPSARVLRRGLAYLRATDPVYDALLRDRLEPRRSRERVKPAEAGVT
jgi:phthiocerol/phenolphthiocerol synthesis type-I polyketide synthase E